MNKYEKALYELKMVLIYNSHKYGDSRLIDLNLETINELVEKATPKKPITDGSTYLPSCNKVQYICPHCKQIMLRTICIKAHKPNYCYKCGQALDWSEDDENS